MERRITVAQLKEQLDWMEAMGLGDYVLEYMDINSMEYPLDTGIHLVDDETKTIVLG